MSSVRPIRQPAARVELPKAPTTGHPARRPSDDADPPAPAAVTVPDVVSPAPAAPVSRRRNDAGEERRVNFGARVRESTRYRARLWSVQNEVDLQDLMDEALDEYLTRHGG